MMKGVMGPPKQLQDLVNWGAFDCASHTPQLSYYIYNVRVHVSTSTRNGCKTYVCVHDKHGHN